MQAGIRAFRMMFRMVLVLLTSILVLIACSSNKPTPPPKDSDLPSSTLPSITQAPTLEASATATLLPVLVDTSGGQNVGVITFSMGEAGYQHLFAYHPNYLPITRITSGEWDDIDPVISPDGTLMVFSSNRSGAWDLYLWELGTNTLSQLTDSPEVETSPDWSPDNQWITYEVYANAQSNIAIRSVTDATLAPIQLTEGVGNNYDPAWSPLGRQIAFSTNRSGRSEIWLAKLDTAENRFSIAASGEEADFIHPSWSPDGSSLAWERKSEDSAIELQLIPGDIESVKKIASGGVPFWSPDGTTVLARVDTPNQSFFTGYAVANGVSVYPLISLPATPFSPHWSGGKSFQNILAILSSAGVTAYETPCQTNPPAAANASGRYSLVNLNSISAPNPMLSDTTDDCFNQLRTVIAHKIGWDLLATLKDAALPLTTPPDPAIPENWLYTGRAVSMNIAPLQAGWMAVSREDYQGKTFWRVWVKCLQQNGSCGLPLSSPVWDFASRASGDLAAFEAGGKQVQPPPGYWVDVTDLASQFGWSRLPSLNNWRTYYPGILFNTFVYQQGLSWQQAMLQLYPQDVISLLEFGK